MSGAPTTIDLPPPVSGQRHEFESKVGRLTYYSASTGSEVGDPPLLLIHSINAAGSAYEVKPLYEHYRATRTVYALELPGFGHSERGNRAYTVRMMTDAIHAVVEQIQNSHVARRSTRWRSRCPANSCPARSARRLWRLEARRSSAQPVSRSNRARPPSTAPAASRGCEPSSRNRCGRTGCGSCCRASAASGSFWRRPGAPRITTKAWPNTII